MENGELHRGPPLVTQLVFLLEEASARAMLAGLLPRLLPSNIRPVYAVFEGKQDLDKNLTEYLRDWRVPGARFVVLRDQNSASCHQVKASLAASCVAAGKPEALIRVACHELETFYLGDLAAVAEVLGPSNLGRRQNEANFRNPDQLPNPSQVLEHLAPNYDKVASSRALGPLLSLDHNRSPSFNALITGLRRLLTQ